MASPTDTAHPLRRLWDFAQDDHRAIVWGTALSILNKFFDVLPELLIGVAVDVVVRGRASLMADWLGIDAPPARSCIATCQPWNWRGSMTARRAACCRW